MEKEVRYKDGETVYAVKHPTIKLLVRRYVPTIYYCTVAGHPEKELVYFERELMSEADHLVAE